MRQEKIANEENEKRIQDKKVTKANKSLYSDDKIVNKEQYAKHLSTSVGDKTKIIEVVTYKNGVVKSKCKGIMKGRHVVSNSGIDKKFLNGAK
jgi:hypothetical protein